MWTAYSKLFIFCVVSAAAVIFFIYILLQDTKTSGGDKTSVSDQTKDENPKSGGDKTSVSDQTKDENPKKVNLLDYSNEFTVVLDDTPLKYILQWTKPDTQPFVFMGVGRDGFIKRKCKFTNCVVTSDRNLLSDVAKFDVVLFHGPELVYVPIQEVTFPKRRSLRQKYVFASMESGHYYPICSEKLNGYFNWTWTFKLDSDARWGYLLVKDSNDTVIGPNKIMHWMKLKDMDPVSEEFKKKLKSKSKIAAWFVSNCGSLSGRQEFANKLEIELRKYGHSIDVFGQCGTKKCGRESNPDNPNCDKMVSDKYYFYLAFENSFSEDYVTEKLLRSLKNNAVPIVFGGANYTRFMPDGIYLNARALGPELLAKKMNELIKDPEEYANYFRWRNHYSYHSREETPEHNDYCNFCALLNNDEKMKEVTVIQNLKDWWDYPQKC